jgi:imidazole glycerol-phosphate synthase subunit HisF
VPAFRIIPCLDVHAGRVVKGVNFINLRDMGDPAELARRYRDEGADELVFLDVSATVEAREALKHVVEAVADVLDLPFTVGGGVRSEEDATALLLAGADKVSVNSAAVADPELIGRLARRFGSQCVVLAIDARHQGTGDRGPGTGDARPKMQGTGESAPATEARQPGADEDLLVPPGPRSPVPGPRSWEVVTHGGRRPTGRDAVAWAREGAKRGAGEILLTSMDRDGTGLGFDVELLGAVRAAMDLPLVASGGGECAAHFAAAARAGADAGLAATIFHQARVAIADLKRDLAAAGVPVRLEGS